MGAGPATESGLTALGLPVWSTLTVTEVPHTTAWLIIHKIGSN